jgi:hypothetical protein
MTQSVGLKKPGEQVRDEAGQPVFDEYGKPVIGPPTTTAVRAWYEPRSSTEDTNARDQVVWGYWVAVDLDVDLDAYDAIVIDGLDYEVDGEAGRQPGGFLVPGFQKVAVARASG